MELFVVKVCKIGVWCVGGGVCVEWQQRNVLCCIEWQQRMPPSRSKLPLNEHFRQSYDGLCVAKLQRLEAENEIKSLNQSIEALTRSLQRAKQQQNAAQKHEMQCATALMQLSFSNRLVFPTHEAQSQLSEDNLSRIFLKAGLVARARGLLTCVYLRNAIRAGCDRGVYTLDKPM